MILPQLLTHSRMHCAKTCLRKHYLSYELRMKPIDSGAPLRMGSAFHLGLEAYDKTAIASDGHRAIIDNYYANRPQWADGDEWDVECEKVVNLYLGHVWRWHLDRYDVVATEREFSIPLIHPTTGEEHERFQLAGKIDRIVRLPDGRLAVQEYKTTSDDLAPDSNYWRRLRIDSQISLYVMAARSLGFDVETVIYDVTRKPAIRPKLVKTVRETSHEYGKRLYGDIMERPDFYFARHEIPRLDADLEDFAAELWQIAGTLGDCQEHGRWFRNTAACLAPYQCVYFNVCTNGIDPAVDGVPAGFEIADTPHLELTGASA